MTLTVAAPLRLEARALRRGCRASNVVTTGMGRQRAVTGGKRLAAAHEGRIRGAVVAAGIAGGLAPGLEPGTVVVADEVRVADGSLEPIRLPSAPVLANALRRAGFSVVVGPLVSASRLARGAERIRLAETGAVAVDMETAWLLDPLRSPGLDPRALAAVRVVVDTLDHELVSAATVRSLRRATQVLRSMGDVLEQWASAVGARDVVLPVPRSFCAGVDRAIEIVERALDRFGAPVYVRRQIVHNTHVVRGLEAAGAVFVEELDQVPAGATVVLAAHGVAPSVRAEAERRELRVIDATCPLVAKVHHEARQHRAQGTRVVLIGHADHEEIVGTLGEVPEAVVISGPDEVAALDAPPGEPMAYLTQTTLAVDETAAVVAALRERFDDLREPASDDICYATQHRQEAVVAIAGGCDLILVVGSANSSNSNRLVEVARRTGRPAHLIEDETELDLAWLKGVATVGITAGASAPELLVDRVVAALGRLGPVTVDEQHVVEESVQFRLPREVR
jgi:4-hydroxy-3-methylbut-2-enyl diphosphate reductase